MVCLIFGNGESTDNMNDDLLRSDDQARAHSTLCLSHLFLEDVVEMSGVACKPARPYTYSVDTCEPVFRYKLVGYDIRMSVQRRFKT